MGCDDSDGPGHAPRYLYVSQLIIHQDEKMSIRQHFNFDTFILPAYIKLLYVVGSIAIIVGGIWIGGWLGGPRGAVAGVGISVLTIIFYRIQLEFVIVVFKIYERLADKDRE